MSMNCKECPYFWDDDEYTCAEQGIEYDYKHPHPTCHYQWNDGDAPCEREERESYEDEPDIPEREEEDDEDGAN